MTKKFDMGGKTYQLQDDLHILADKVIAKRGLNIEPAKIQYMLVYPHISKTTGGRCIKNKPENVFLTGYHYIVEFSGDLWDKLADETQEILMWHELEHVEPKMKKNGDWVYNIRSHNVQDFANIIAECGVNWIDNLKTQISSVYDLDPKDTDNISW